MKDLTIVCSLMVVVCSFIYYYNANPVALVVGLWCGAALLSVGLGKIMEEKK